MLVCVGAEYLFSILCVKLVRGGRSSFLEWPLVTSGDSLVVGCHSSGLIELHV